MPLGKTDPEAIVRGLKAENARLRDLAAQSATAITQLRAELELLRPKPVVSMHYLDVRLNARGLTELTEMPNTQNLKLTFTNGVLTGAEVVG